MRISSYLVQAALGVLTLSKVDSTSEDVFGSPLEPEVTLEALWTLLDESTSKETRFSP
jgi:hypothetical protein